MLRSALVAAPIALAAAGCSIENGLGDQLPEFGAINAPPVENVQQEDRIVQVTTPMVDILWTIDNSGSMYDEQQDLTAAFPAFMAYFLDSGLDYHIGVTSTDIDNNTNGSKGKLVTIAGTKYIDVDTLDPMGMFSQMAQLGTNGSSSEKGIGATYKCLEELRDTANAGFYRDESAIHTIVISDEPDSTSTALISQPEFVEWYDNLKPEADMRSFSAIVNMQVGTKYKNSALAIGGIVWDITQTDWPQLLERLGVQAAGLKREYFLSQLPVPGTLVVSIDDVSGAHLEFSECDVDPVTGEPYVDPETGAPTDPDCDYTYDANRNSVTFVTFIPNPLSTVIMTYTLLASQHDQIDQISE